MVIWRRSSSAQLGEVHREPPRLVAGQSVAERSLLRLAERVGELFGPACGSADGPIRVSGRAEQHRDREISQVALVE